jgi:hypothetical protein
MTKKIRNFFSPKKSSFLYGVWDVILKNYQKLYWFSVSRTTFNAKSVPDRPCTHSAAYNRSPVTNDATKVRRTNARLVPMTQSDAKQKSLNTFRCRSSWYNFLSNETKLKTNVSVYYYSHICLGNADDTTEHVHNRLDIYLLSIYITLNFNRYIYNLFFFYKGFSTIFKWLRKSSKVFLKAKF